MSSILKQVVALSSLLTLALAVPNVTVVPATGGCSVYPSYDASTGIAGPWTIILNDSDNPDIEDFGDNCQLFRTAGETGIHEGRISIAYVNDEAKIAIRCNDNTGSILEALTPTGVSGYAWNQVNITEYPYDAEIMWGLGQYSTPLEPYYHFVNGTQMTGLYLGQNNVTTWGVKLYPVDGDNTLDNEPYWQLRLLGPDSALPWNGSALYPDEYQTFLRIGA